MDKRLGIVTDGLILTYANADCQIYQPTPYEALELLAAHVTPEDTVIDFGCGRGRVCFYLADKVGCQTVGVECMPRIYDRALRNLETYKGDKSKVSFVLMNAADYQGGNIGFFFNPFSTDTFRRVLKNNRLERLIFYGIRNDWKAILQDYILIEEVDCGYGLISVYDRKKEG